MLRDNRSDPAMSPHSPGAATLHLDLLIFPDDPEAWGRLLAGLPEGLAAVLSAHGGLQRRRVLVAAGSDGRAIGLAHLASRPATAQAKLDVLWAPDGAPLRDLLLPAEAERQAAAEGAVLLKLQVARPRARPWSCARQAMRRCRLRRRSATPAPAWAYYAERKRGALGCAAGLLQPGLTAFTCGPVCLGMALAGFGLTPLSRAEEIQIWREATTVRTPAGPGDCDPFGLALAAARRGRWRRESSRPPSRPSCRTARRRKSSATSSASCGPASAARPRPWGWRRRTAPSRWRNSWPRSPMAPWSSC